MRNIEKNQNGFFKFIFNFFSEFGQKMQKIDL